MGHKLAIVADSVLRRTLDSEKSPPAAKRAAREELGRRARLDRHCPRGAGCTDFDCQRAH